MQLMCYGAFHHATEMARIADRRVPGCSWRASTCSSSTSPSRRSAGTSAGPRSARCRGSSAATRSCSPRCSYPRGAGRTRSGASARSCSASGSSWRRAPRARSRRRSASWSRARVVQAAGGALMLPTSLGLMLPEFGPHERHVAIGMWAATGGIAAAAGPPLGGLLVQADWRWVFLVNVPVGLAGLGFGLRTLPSGARSAPGARTCSAPVALIVAIGALVVAIVKGQEWGWGSPAILALLAVTAVGLPAIWWRSERHDCADRRAGDAARAQLRPGGRRVGAVLRGLRRDAAGRRAVPDGRVARARADGRPDAVPGPGDGDGLQRALGAPGRALRLPHAGRRRRAAVRRRPGLLHHADGRHARVCVGVPAGDR